MCVPIPANPMLRKSFLYGYYQLYCGDAYKLEILCAYLGKDIDVVKFNEDYGVYDFICETDQEKEMIDDLFEDSMILDMDLEEDGDEG